MHFFSLVSFVSITRSFQQHQLQHQLQQQQQQQQQHPLCLRVPLREGLLTTEAVISSRVYTSNKGIVSSVSSLSLKSISNDQQDNKQDNKNDNIPKEDTIRIRIWKALVSGEELSLKELGAIVGERQIGDLRSHLAHVEKQAKTLKNKSKEWRQRRGLEGTSDDTSIDASTDASTDSSSSGTMDRRKINKLRLITRRGKKNNVYVRLG